MSPLGHRGAGPRLGQAPRRDAGAAVEPRRVPRAHPPRDEALRRRAATVGTRTECRGRAPARFGQADRRGEALDARQETAGSVEDHRGPGLLRVVTTTIADRTSAAAAGRFLPASAHPPASLPTNRPAESIRNSYRPARRLPRSRSAPPPGRKAAPPPVPAARSQPATTARGRRPPRGEAVALCVGLRAARDPAYPSCQRRVLRPTSVPALTPPGISEAKGAQPSGCVAAHPRAVPSGA